MGHPKMMRKKYEKPKRPYDNLEEEKKILKEFGLRRKKEIMKAETILRDFRRRARILQASRNPEQEKIIIEKLKKIGLDVKSLDDILKLTVYDILSRRLQTIVFKKGFGNSIKHTRQLIVHGNILIDGRKIMFPSFLVPVEMEEKIILNKLMQKPENKISTQKNNL